MSVPPRKYHILVTLGPTWEFIDPIRFITNRATGTLGRLIAREGLRRGHRVTCVAGPTQLSPLPRARWVSVVSANEMHRAVASAFPKADVLVMSAAVSDYRAKKIFRSKLKRKRKKVFLALKANRDILGSLRPERRQVLVGFAVETKDLLKNALQKLREKKLDLIVANQFGEKQNPFGDRRVSVHFLWKDGRHRELKRAPKQKIASVLLEAIEALIAAKGLAR